MFQTLPNEVLIEIFKNLNRSELLKVSEVSKRFFVAATDTKFWKNFDISHRSLEDKIKLLQLSRCKKLKTLSLKAFDGGVNNELLQILMKIDVEKLLLKWIDFESIDKVLLANVISKTRAIKLVSPGNLEQDHINMILNKIPGSSLKVLAVAQVKFSGIASRTIAKAINSLETFEIGDENHFDELQMMETFEEMSKKTNLKKILIHNEVLKKIPARILGKALNKIHHVVCFDDKENSLTSEQIIEIFNQMAHQTNLQTLLLLFPDASEGSLISYPADILARVINKLKVFIAPLLKFSESQIKSVLQSIDLSKTQELDLGSCHEPQFSLLDRKRLMSVSNKIKGHETFKLLLLIKHLEMSIEELQNVQKEKLSAEEKKKQWELLAWELNLFANKMVQIDYIHELVPRMDDVYRNIGDRVAEAFRTISLSSGCNFSYTAII